VAKPMTGAQHQADNFDLASFRTTHASELAGDPTATAVVARLTARAAQLGDAYPQDRGCQNMIGYLTTWKANTDRHRG
jgi:hypothetical protein